MIDTDHLDRIIAKATAYAGARDEAERREVIAADPVAAAQAAETDASTAAICHGTLQYCATELVRQIELLRAELAGAYASGYKAGHGDGYAEGWNAAGQVLGA
jgi:flagellar biosynthesis/type III secretory pathway protein FliH